MCIIVYMVLRLVSLSRFVQVTWRLGNFFTFLEIRDYKGYKAELLFKKRKIL